MSRCISDSCSESKQAATTWLWLGLRGLKTRGLQGKSYLEKKLFDLLKTTSPCVLESKRIYYYLAM